MTEDTKQTIENGTQSVSDGTSTEQDLEVYPLRAPSEDPRWAVRIVWTWVGMALLLLLFLITLLILGFWYD